MGRESLRGITIKLTIIVIIGKLFGFFREVLLAHYFGTGIVVDAYIMGYTIPAILFGALPAIAMGFTPCYFKINAEKRDEFTSRAIIASGIIAIICIGITYAFATNIVRLIARGFEGDLFSLTVKYLKVTIWTILFNTPIQIMISYLNCRRLYLFSNVTNLLLSSVQCIFVVSAAYIDIELLPFGLLISYIVQFILLLIFSAWKGFKFRIVNVYDKNIKILFKFAFPMFISNLLVDINGFVDKYFASFLKEGSIAALNYAFTIRALFYYVFTSAITTLFYPNVTELIVNQKIEQATKEVQNAINIIIMIFIPLSFIGMFLAEDMIYIVLQRGKFDEESLKMTVSPFICYMFSLLVISVRDLIIKVMYAYGDSKSNLKYGAVSVGANIIFSFILVQKFSHIGLALGTSMSAIITFPVYNQRLKKLLPGVSIRKEGSQVVKVIISCIPMIIMFLVVKIFNIGICRNMFIEIMKVFLLCAMSVVLTMRIMYSMKVDGFDKLINQFVEKSSI